MALASKLLAAIRAAEKASCNSKKKRTVPQPEDSLGKGMNIFWTPEKRRGPSRYRNYRYRG